VNQINSTNEALRGTTRATTKPYRVPVAATKENVVSGSMLNQARHLLLKNQSKIHNFQRLEERQKIGERRMRRDQRLANGNNGSPQRPMPPELRVLNERILLALETNQGDSAIQLYRTVKEHQPQAHLSIDAYNGVVELCARAGDIGGVRDVFAHLRSASVRPFTKTYNAAIRGYLKSGRYEQARELLRLMSEQRAPESMPNRQSYHMMLKHLRMNRDVAEMKQLLAEMEHQRQLLVQQVDKATTTANDLAASNNGQQQQLSQAVVDVSSAPTTPAPPPINIEIVPDVETYNIFLSTAAFEGNASIMNRWLATIKKRGLEPNINTYAYLIIGNAHIFPKVLKLMDEVAERPDLQPNSLYLLALLKAAGRSRRSDMVERFWQYATNQGAVQPSAEHYLNAVLAYACEGRYDQCRRMWSQMLRLATPLPSMEQLEKFVANISHRLALAPHAWRSIGVTIKRTADKEDLQYLAEQLFSDTSNVKNE
jgi:pentatricopeptide repeat protein